MKTTILSIAAAAAITLGAAGAATAASPTGNAGLFEGGSAAPVQLANHRGFRGRRHLGGRYGRGVNRRVRCRRLYYRGFVLGDLFARRMFNRFCTYRHGYRYRFNHNY